MINLFSNEVICKVIKYIDLNLFRRISLDDLENEFFYNKYYLVKLFKKEIGYTIFDYINSLRIFYSIKDINNNDRSITYIALDRGFNSLEYFSEIFKKVVGVSPRKYKQSLSHFNNLNDDEIFLIHSSVIKITDLFRFKNDYLLNVKPKISPVKNLTLFR